MGKVVEWSDLPEELVDIIAKRSSSNIHRIRIRSICKPWRSAVAANKRYQTALNAPFLVSKRKTYFLSPATFYCVTLPSSCPKKGWLIKSEVMFESKYKPESGEVELSCPLSRRQITSSNKTLDLLKFGVSEILQSYNVQYMEYYISRKHEYVDKPISRYSGKVVVVDNLVFAANYKKEIWCCKSGEESNSDGWIRIENEEVKYFLDIRLYKGQIYALDLNGAIWWFSLSELNIFPYGTSTPLDYCKINSCKEKRLVEFSGDLCVVHRFCEEICVKGQQSNRTVGFIVYKMDKELMRWVKVDSLGDKALIVATHSCFTVSACEYYGCLENAIYFSDGEDVSVFKLHNDSIITKKIDSDSSSSHQSCFKMFSAPFL